MSSRESQPNIYDPCFSSAQVATAAGMTNPTFLHYVRNHGWRPMGAGTLAESNGLGHTFSIYDALGLALARQLVDHGVSPKVAFDRAMLDFAHSGDDRRPPGEVFDVRRFGRTVYAYSHGAELGECFATKETSDVMSLFS